MASGGRQKWHAVGCYIAPDGDLTIESGIASTSQNPIGVLLLVAGDFNAYLSEPEGNEQDEDISATLITTDIEGMSNHFLLRHK